MTFDALYQVTSVLSGNILSTYFLYHSAFITASTGLFQESANIQKLKLKTCFTYEDALASLFTYLLQGLFFQELKQ